MTRPQPGTPEWLDAKRGGPRWTWEDARGVRHEGYMEKFSDRGGTDVTYFMRRDPSGELDCVSGQRCKDMKRVFPESSRQEADEYNRDLALRARNGQVGSGMKFRG